MEVMVLMEGVRGMLVEGVVVVGVMSKGTRMTNDEGINFHLSSKVFKTVKIKKRRRKRKYQNQRSFSFYHKNRR